MKKNILTIILAVVTGIVFADTTAEIPNFQEAVPGVYTGGQPTMLGMNIIAEKGVRAVINLRAVSEQGARDESVEANILKLAYYNIPFTTSSFDMDKVNEFAKAFRQKKNLPIFIHCKEGNRVGGLWLAYRVLLENKPMGTSLKEARQMGLNPEFEDIVISLILNERVERPATQYNPVTGS